MANVLVERQSLEDTADAIRQKLGSTAPIKPRDFAANIAVIQGVSGLSVIRKEGNVLVFPNGHFLAEIEETRLNLPMKVLLIE